ncbi:MAG: bifunctional folylpolyglutamate synthase/dihydrofolate synthase [Ignavibacteriales bacterium]
MNTSKSLEYIEKTAKFGSDLSLDRISVLMSHLGNPQDNLKFVHVAGTNGKGSTCSMIESVLIKAGYKTGKFISPHLEHFNERISINGLYISDDDIERLSIIVMEKAQRMVGDGFEHPTQFEIICAMAFEFFYEQKCDIVVLEVGLGGRLDATNIIKNPLVSVITTISYDHTDRLGFSLAEIAKEKAGIIKHGCMVISAPQEAETADIITETCKQRQCDLFMVDEKKLIEKQMQEGFQVFDFEGYTNLKLELLGWHQIINASVAIKAIEALKNCGFEISSGCIFQGLETARNNGRFEVLGYNPEVLIDGAHNISGINALKEALTKYYSGKRIILVMAVLSVKNYQEMVDILAPIADLCIVSEPISDSALSAEELAGCFKKNKKDCIIEKDINKAVDIALNKAQKQDVICFCGSLYFIGRVRTCYLDKKRNI